jgi:hypothetical protein
VVGIDEALAEVVAAAAAEEEEEEVDEVHSSEAAYTHLYPVS